MRCLLSVFGAALASSVAVCAVAITARPAKPAASQVDFNRDVRPILSGHCFKCHGPDVSQRKAGLRLDSRAGATAVLPTGERAIVPGKPDRSPLVTRIFAAGPSQMPPITANKPLSAAEKETLRRWILDGAVYKPHWAFVQPVRQPLPTVRLTAWPRNPIDRFVLSRMEAAGLTPSPEADRYTLVRRVFLDLIGLPPTPQEADAFIRDSRPDAYERLVDGLLASKHYGERWARRWLDLARYADTNGFEKDRPRPIWPYRDWVIDALNADMPFDQFTIKQLAGDMLPNATINDLVATGFHRNTMLNEEGGIDPLEYRFYSMVDRTNVTGTAWLGLTVGCAQCHSHKFDPITQREYYSLMACMDNAEEPEIEIPKADLVARRNKLESGAVERESRLAERFPAEQSVQWLPVNSVRLISASSQSGARLEPRPDGSLLVSGANPDTDTYTVILETSAQDSPRISAMRLETLTDPSLGGMGPGRTPHGNFVLTEFSAAADDAAGTRRPVKLTDAQADFTQEDFSAAATLDGDPKTGWAIHGSGTWNTNRTIRYHLERQPVAAGPVRWTITLGQTYGGHHTIGHFRIGFGATSAAGLSGPENLQRKFAEWRKTEENRAVNWTVLRPASAVSNLPKLNILSDDSVFVTGDEGKRDVYDLDFKSAPEGLTAIRLEVLPDERLPNRGPGRVFYEGSPGDFFLSEATVITGGQPAKIARATASFGANPQAMIDGDPQSGWNIAGGQGRAHTAVFKLEKPLQSGDFSFRMLFERYHAADLGRFRISVTTDSRPVEAGLPPDDESALMIPSSRRTEAQTNLLLKHYLSVAPELAVERAEIQRIRDAKPPLPTTLALRERPGNNPRATYVHHRGEYLQPAEKVDAGVLAILPAPASNSLNRLSFARWLVDGRNPLTARVTVNRQWQAFFGQGIVRTLQDFGYQGDPPTHPELLDWLAVELTNPSIRDSADAEMPKRWSIKHIHRLIVTSATYLQSSGMSPRLREKDPENRLLARGPRVRLDAEELRDSALRACGLLSEKMGGPSVFPPQPPGVTSEGTYGPLAWRVSEGEDRYRRGLYTFSKRTAPYAMFTTFDAPTGEAICPRREVSNTPLQALTMMNDQVFVEAAQALGRTAAVAPGPVEARAADLFRRCATRPPGKEELALLVAFYGRQRDRFAKKEMDAQQVAGTGDGDVNERAAWTALARSILNLDEVIVKR